MCNRCDQLATVPPGGGNGLIMVELVKAACGQHWMWDGGWKAISRLKYQTIMDAQNAELAALKSERQAESLGPQWVIPQT